MADVFVSYSRADALRVEQLVQTLEVHGLSVWWDRSLEQGAQFAQLIRDEISHARVVVVCWSETAAASKWVQAEADEAAHQGKYIGSIVSAGRPPPPFNIENNANLIDWGGAADDLQFLNLLKEVGRLAGRADIAERVDVQRKALRASEARDRAKAEAAKLKEEQERQARELQEYEQRNAEKIRAQEDAAAEAQRRSEELDGLFRDEQSYIQAERMIAHQGRDAQEMASFLTRRTAVVNIAAISIVVLSGWLALRFVHPSGPLTLISGTVTLVWWLAVTGVFALVTTLIAHALGERFLWEPMKANARRVHLTRRLDRTRRTTNAAKDLEAIRERRGAERLRKWMKDHIESIERIRYYDRNEEDREFLASRQWWGLD